MWLFVIQDRAVWDHFKKASSGRNPKLYPCFPGSPRRHKRRDDLSEGGGRGASFFFQERCTSGFKPERPKASTRSGVMAAPQVAEDGSRGSRIGTAGFAGVGCPDCPGPRVPAARLRALPSWLRRRKVSHVKDRVTPLLGGRIPPAARGARLREARARPRAAAPTPGASGPRAAAQCSRARSRAGRPHTRARAQGPARSEGEGAEGAARGEGEEEAATASPPAGLALALALALRLARAPRG